LWRRSGLGFRIEPLQIEVIQTGFLAFVPGILFLFAAIRSRTTSDTFARSAKTNRTQEAYPYSKATRRNIDVTIDMV